MLTRLEVHGFKNLVNVAVSFSPFTCIAGACVGVSDGSTPVPVVPVRMSEAWLLCDEQAIRKAAGSPNGEQPLDLPRLKDVEGLPDPKSTLQNKLRSASGLTGRRLRAFTPRARLVADYMTDFAALRRLSAFQRLESDVQVILEEQGTSAIHGHRQGDRACIGFSARAKSA